MMVDFPSFDPFHEIGGGQQWPGTTGNRFDLFVHKNKSQQSANHRERLLASIFISPLKNIFVPQQALVTIKAGEISP
jgi:hypothetical protein